MQPGIVHSVAYKGRVLKAGGLGVKAKGSTDVPDSNTIFRVGSVSKVFPVSKICMCNVILSQLLLYVGFSYVPNVW